MNCPDCGRTVEVSWKFCASCGWQVQSFIRRKVFEALVRHAIRGGAWKEACAWPMQVHGISMAEVDDEVARRNVARARRYAAATQSQEVPLRDKLADIRGALSTITQSKSNAPVINELATVLEELEGCLKDLENQVDNARKLKKERTLKPATKKRSS